MANQRHLNKLCEGVSTWNQWREEHPEILPDLRKAGLRGAVLTGIDFRRTNFDGADLHNAKLCSVSLHSASICQTNLSGARFRHAYLHRTYFKETILQHTNLHKASLLNTTFLHLDLNETINLENRGSPWAIDNRHRYLPTIQGKYPRHFSARSGVSEQLLAVSALQPVGPLITTLVSSVTPATTNALLRTSTMICARRVSFAGIHRRA